MAGTYTWVTGSQSLAGALPTGFLPPTILPIPANGILKRFQLRLNLFQAEVDGTSLHDVGPISVEQQIYYVDPAFVSRAIFQSRRRVPTDTTAIWLTVANVASYSTNYSACDDELEVNQGCSYGKHTDLFPKSVRAEVGLYVGVGGSLTGVSGDFSYQFAALYLTLP